MFTIFLNLVASIVRLFEFLLFARAIFSWFSSARNSKIAEFLYFTTEPLIMPFRSLLSRVNAFRGMPIDMSFLLTYIVLEIVLAALTGIM